MKYFIIIALALNSMFVFSQNELHCGTDIIMRKFYALHPTIEAQKQQQDIDAYHKKIATANSASYTIPIVFHVLHMGGPENISDAQVRDAVTILNRDYAKQNSDIAFVIPEFQAIADSTKIQFVLATKDPNGNCTNGIVHYYDTDTDWNDASPTIYQYTWDPTKYLNVYIVKTITLGSGFGAAGYTYLPGTVFTGSQQDAIVVLNNYFGSIGTGNAFLSRVLTHEVGHWLGLYHVFGATNGAGVNCLGDDFISDTPPTAGFLSCPNSSNPSSYQLCTPGISENFQNYMDYSYCCKMFTQEQCLKMQSTLQSTISGRNNLSSTSNLLATGVSSPTQTCIPLADFKYNRSETCIGAPVTFYDASTNATASSYTWSFSGGTPNTSHIATPTVVYNTPGVYSVTYTAASSAGVSLPMTKTNIITVTNNTATYIAPLIEGFENNALPNIDWHTENSSGGSNWEQSWDASYSGTYCAKLPLTNNTRLAITSMISPMIDISSLTAPVLTFQLATAESNPNHINNLKVFVSTDCENTWLPLYSKTGATLVTSSSTMNPFVPTSLSDWRHEIISLSTIAGSPRVKFKFTYTRDTIPAANNVFMDDINITNTTSLPTFDEKTPCRIFPNPSSNYTTIQFYNHSFTKISIVDVLGQLIAVADDTCLETGIFSFAVGKETAFTSGMYFINLEHKNGVVTKKLIVN